MKKYCSTNQIERLSYLKPIGYNPFINGQDLPPNFIKSLNIKQNKIEKNSYQISLLEHNEEYKLLDIKVILEENQPKSLQ